MQETRERILDALGDGAISGPQLAGELDISRAAVWKHVEQLREMGFTITSGGDGYELEAVPEFGSGAIEFGLEAPYDLEYHDSIPSTNARARELAADGQENVVVLADEQSGGRGRLDREWRSPSGGIWLSVLLRPNVPAPDAPVFTLAAAVATARAAREAGVDATIKWPNDVLVEGQKLSGILTEMEGEADRITWLVVGIGLNANLDPETLPAAADATSLRAAVGDVDRRTVTQTLLSEFHHLTEHTDEILPAWRELSATLGTEVRVDRVGDSITGRAVDVEYPGALVVETDDSNVTVTTGDCEHLRPLGN